MSALPTLTPYTFRHFQGDADFPLMLEVINRTKIAEGVQRTDTLEDIKNGYAHLDNCDPKTDVLMAFAGDELVAYSRHQWTPYETHTGYFSFGFVVPEHQHNGLGSTMRQWHEDRLSEVAATHDSDATKYLESVADIGSAGQHALMKKCGYEAHRFAFQMMRDLNQPIPELSLPEDITVRLCTEKDYRAVWEADVESFAESYGAPPRTETEYQMLLKDPNFDPSIWQVAWDGAEVVGGVLNRIDPDYNAEYNTKIGWTDPIFVRKPWRKQGIAKALIARSFKLLRDEKGMTHARLWVDAENESGALQLYESMGFEVTEKMTMYRKLLA